MWPMLLEKVFAKLAGSYLNLKGGSGGQADFGSTQVMHMLTGGTVFHHFRRSNTEQSLWVTQRTREVTAGPETTSQCLALETDCILVISCVNLVLYDVKIC